MKEFKVGDKLKLKTKGVGAGVPAGSVLTCVSERNPQEGFYLSCTEVSVEWANEHKHHFEEVFNLKTQPWFIRVNNKEEFDLIQEWLLENFGKKLEALHWGVEFLTNTTFKGEISNRVMWGSGNPKQVSERQELFPQFKQSKMTLESVVLPQIPEVETEVQKQVRELEETIRKASEQIKQLKDMK